MHPAVLIETIETALLQVNESLTEQVCRGVTDVDFLRDGRFPAAAASGIATCNEYST